MSTNDAVRNAQKVNSFVRPETSLTAAVAQSTGVAEEDVVKVLDHLGFSKNFAQAVQLNNGQEPQVSNVRIGFRLGRSLVVM